MIAALLLLLATAVSGQTAPASEIRFAGIPWKSSAATVKAEMARLEFKFVEVDKEGDLIFSGSIAGESARIFAFRTKNDTLVKWQIVVAPPDHRTLKYYESLKSEMIERYGKPDFSREEWKYPYNDGDHVGHEETAIKNGKGVLVTLWSTKGELPAIVIEVTDRLFVSVSYEGPGWSEEAARRKKRVW